jgi:hypothetical protein
MAADGAAAAVALLLGRKLELRASGVTKGRRAARLGGLGNAALAGLGTAELFDCGVVSGPLVSWGRFFR